MAYGHGNMFCIVSLMSQLHKADNLTITSHKVLWISQTFLVNSAHDHHIRNMTFLPVLTLLHVLPFLIQPMWFASS